MPGTTLPVIGLVLTELPTEYFPNEKGRGCAGRVTPCTLRFGEYDENDYRVCLWSMDKSASSTRLRPGLKKVLADEWFKGDARYGCLGA